MGEETITYQPNPLRFAFSLKSLGWYHTVLYSLVGGTLGLIEEIPSRR